MNKISDLNMDHYFFSGETVDGISVLTFKNMPILHISDLEAKKALFDFLELISSRDDIKVLLIKGAPVKMERGEYISHYKEMIASGAALLPLERMYNALNQFILQMVNLNKMVIHADSGNILLLFMNISLACDYRIVADNTIYHNPNIELGVVPKGGSVFFLSKMLGAAAASRVLLSSDNVTAVQAHQLGIVDKVVPLEELDSMAWETAQHYAALPSGYTVGIKKLLNFDIKELIRYLEFEDALLRKLVRSYQ